MNTTTNELTKYIEVEINKITELKVKKGYCYFILSYQQWCLNQSLIEKITYYHNSPVLEKQENYTLYFKFKI